MQAAREWTEMSLGAGLLTSRYFSVSRMLCAGSSCELLALTKPRLPKRVRRLLGILAAGQLAQVSAKAHLAEVG